MVFPCVVFDGRGVAVFDALELEKSEQTPVAKTVTHDASAIPEPNRLAGKIARLPRRGADAPAAPP